MSRHPNPYKGALSGVSTAQLVRRSGDCQPIGEVFRHEGGWKAYAGYELPAECRGTWDLKVEAIAAINQADTLHNRGTYYGPI